MSAVVIPVAVLLLIGAALAPGHSADRPSRFGVVALAKHSSETNPLGVRIHKVYGSNVPASKYGTEVADREDQGVNTRGEMISDLSPLPTRAFDGPIAAYKRYAVHWSKVAQSDARTLRDALAYGTRTQSRSAWRAAWAAYLHLGAVYGLFGSINQKIDGTPGGLPQGERDSHFSGFHRIEMGLWGHASPRSLESFADLLIGKLGRLRSTLPTIAITPLEYATRAHEILEDAQRDLLSGTEVPWSQEGVLGTAAGLAATQEVFATLQPLLDGRENTEAEVRSQLELLQTELTRIRRAHRGWPALGQLSLDERERLNGTLAGALGALELLPGTLETQSPQPLPRIPGSPRPAE